MNRKMKLKVRCLAAMILLGVFLLVWIRCQKPGKEPESNSIIVVEEEKRELTKVDVKTAHDNEALFTVSAEDFIRSFNSLFAYDYGSDYFPPLAEWSARANNSGIHSQYPTMRFWFSEDENIFTLPTVTVYTPMEERCIQEITINYDEHSYTETGFQRYKQLCSYTLRVFFPTLSEEAACQLCDRVIALGNENIFASDAWYGSGAVPCALFYKDGVGIYPYFAIGDWQRFCVIPVTDELINGLKQKGVELYEIQENTGFAAPDGAAPDSLCSSQWTA